MTVIELRDKLNEIISDGGELLDVLFEDTIPVTENYSIEFEEVVEICLQKDDSYVRLGGL